MMQNTRAQCRQMMTEAQLMRRIRETDFAMQEAKLFLNTHPHCRKALRYFSEVRNAYLAAVAEYEKRFGPITAAGNNCENGWSWTDMPWPWQNDVCGYGNEGRLR